MGAVGHGKRALFPRWFPLHTRRLWSYCRTVYMPMSFVYVIWAAVGLCGIDHFSKVELIRKVLTTDRRYGAKFEPTITPVIRELREELIFEPYASTPGLNGRSVFSRQA